jgi:hypothetical protein
MTGAQALVEAISACGDGATIRPVSLQELHAVATAVK